MSKFTKQYNILKLMLGNFNVCCLILIKIFILCAHVNFALCSLLWCVKKMACVMSTLIHRQRKDATFLKNKKALDHYLAFFCLSTTQIIRDFSQILNPHWITIHASSSFENITSFLWLRIWLLTSLFSI